MTALIAPITIPFSPFHTPSKMLLTPSHIRDHSPEKTPDRKVDKPSNTVFNPSTRGVIASMTGVNTPEIMPARSDKTGPTVFATSVATSPKSSIMGVSSSMTASITGDSASKSDIKVGRMACIISVMIGTIVCKRLIIGGR